MRQKYEQQMKKGVLEMLVLQLLSEKEKYPILYRMEDDGLVTSKWSEPRGKEVSKKYYRITGQGKETLLRLKLLWRAFSESVDEIIED